MGIILNLLLPGAFALQDESSNKPKCTDGQALYNPELDLKRLIINETILSPRKCFYDIQVTPYPLPKNETTGKFLLGSADTLTDLDQKTDKHLSEIIFKDLVKLIDNYFYYYENGTSPFNYQDLLKNGIDFNDPQIQEILDVSDGQIYKTTFANHGGQVTTICSKSSTTIKNGDQLYFSPCSLKSIGPLSPHVANKTTPEGEHQQWCALSSFACGMDSHIKDSDTLSYRCMTSAQCKGPDHQTESCSDSQNFYIR